MSGKKINKKYECFPLHLHNLEMNLDPQPSSATYKKETYKTIRPNCYPI